MKGVTLFTMGDRQVEQDSIHSDADAISVHKAKLSNYQSVHIPTLILHAVSLMSCGYWPKNETVNTSRWNELSLLVGGFSLKDGVWCSEMGGA